MMEGILQVLVGGLLALGGAYIGPHFQRKHEKWRALREDEQLLRSMAAELYEDLDRIIAESHQSTISAMKRLMDDDAEPSPLPDLGKIRMLVSVYFPSAEGVITDYEAQNDALSKRLVSELEAATKGPNSPEKIKVISTLLVTERNKHSYEFVKALRSHIAKVTPRLK